MIREKRYKKIIPTLKAVYAKLASLHPYHLRSKSLINEDYYCQSLGSDLQLKKGDHVKVSMIRYSGRHIARSYWVEGRVSRLKASTRKVPQTEEIQKYNRFSLKPTTGNWLVNLFTPAKKVDLAGRLTRNGFWPGLLDESYGRIVKTRA